MRPQTITKSMVAGVVGSICAAQVPGGAGALLINGSLATGGVATTDTQRRIQVTTSGADVGKTVTLTGTDDNGNVIGEVIILVSTGTVSSLRDYKTVTSAVISAAASSLTLDTTAVGSSQPIILNWHGQSQVGVMVDDPGATSYTIESTKDDPAQAFANWPYSQGGFGSPSNTPALPTTAAPGLLPTWNTHPNLTAKSANAQDSYGITGTIPRPFAIRLTLNAATSKPVVATIIQAGLAGT
jgi:hypothetical protein